MTANNRHFYITRLFTFQFRDKGVGTNNIQRSNAKQLVFVINTGFFQHFRSDSHSGVNRVSDNANARFRASFRNLLNQILHNTGVNVKQVGTIHTRFTRYTCRDKNDICAFQRRSRIFTRKTFDFHSSRDMAQIDSHTGSHWSDIIQGEF